MYLVAIAWLYVALMMALAEAMSPRASVLGAIVTFVLYGLLPVTLVLYLMSARLKRKRLRRERSMASTTDNTLSSANPDARRHAAAGTEPGGVTAVREERG